MTMRVCCRKWNNCFTGDAVTVVIGMENESYNFVTLCVLQLIGLSINDNDLRFKVLGCRLQSSLSPVSLDTLLVTVCYLEFGPC
jgi:hypothetical protein